MMTKIFVRCEQFFARKIIHAGHSSTVERLVLAGAALNLLVNGGFSAFGMAQAELISERGSF
jgi:hypothetical protein